MIFNSDKEIALAVILSSLCLVICVKLLGIIRSMLPWRVNCWFCNHNTWVKYPERNSWTCPKCEQYNGFTKDGDYNKPLISSEQMMKTPKVFHRSPPKNGLCKMCNINQQLKVAQLANFVPMNENNFSDEIEAYRSKLEKAYSLCSPCKKVVQMKLHKEKEILLHTKLLEARSPDKKLNEKKQNTALRDFLNNVSMTIAFILLLLVAYESCNNFAQYNLPKSIKNFMEITKNLLDRVYSILKVKLFMTFPSIESYVYDENSYVNVKIDMPLLGDKIFEILFAQKVLGGFVCVIQIVASILNLNSLKYTIVIDLLWTVYVVSLAQHLQAENPLVLSLIKMTSALTLIYVYRSIKTRISDKSSKLSSPPKKMKNHTAAMKSFMEEDDIAIDTDDDVSLSKFGLHNTSESSNETISPLSASLLNGRCFTPRSDSLWTKPKHNSTFCINPVMTKSPTLSDTVFAKPTFNKYQKLAQDDSDSDLDESISCLSIGSPSKSKKKTNSIFSLRKFTATPSFAAPTPMNRSRPLISPSKLSTSWVAGGYWGSESERQNIFKADGSRSSSQSSGFESQASSMNQRNVFSQPPSREESVCGEPMVLDRFPNMSNLTSFQSSAPQSFMSSPVFPQMQFNNHVHIPQARFAQQTVPHIMYSQQNQYVAGSLFKTPGGSGLLKTSQINSFTSR